MKNLKILLIATLCMVCLAQCKKKDPCPDLGSFPGVPLGIKIVDKNTNQSLIGIGKQYHPDSVKIIETGGWQYKYYPILGIDGDYLISSYIQHIGPYSKIIYLNKDDKDTLKIYAGGEIDCQNQRPYKIYYKGNLIKETSGDDDIYKSINLLIKK